MARARWPGAQSARQRGKVDEGEEEEFTEDHLDGQRGREERSEEPACSRAGSRLLQVRVTLNRKLRGETFKHTWRDEEGVGGGGGHVQLTAEPQGETSQRLPKVLFFTF